MSAIPASFTAPAALAEVLQQLERWVSDGWLRELDRAFAAFLAQEADDADPLLILAAALASHQVGRGHACLDLQASLDDAGAALALPPDHAPLAASGDALAPAALLGAVDLARWQAALRHPQLVDDGAGAAPLVLAGHRLYLRRYWQYEQSVRRAIDARLAAPVIGAVDEAPLREALDVLFPRVPGEAGTDWQRVACALAARHGFGIVTGGPGTGKTTTVVKLLAVLQHLTLTSGGRRLRIRLAAPTGKAAARLGESIAGAVARLPLEHLPGGEALRAAIPREVTTVHRLLGARPDTRRLRHDAHDPLPLDVLVIDEASMVDLEMMAAVFAALPPTARLVLLGDKDQLASVEAGAVLGDLCRRADAGHYTIATRDWLQSATGETLDAALVDEAGLPLDQAVVKLRRSHRFSAGSGIGRLAEAVNVGDVAAVRGLQAEAPPDLAWLRLGSQEASLKRLVLDGARSDFPAGGDGAVPPPVGYRHYLGVLRESQPDAGAARHDFDEWARAVLAAHARFQLLCPLRRGPHGVEALNQRIAAMLFAEGLTPAAHGWYLGRPVMVTRNDAGLGLMNGDVGITLTLPHRDEGEAAARWIPRVAFAAGDGSAGIRWVLPSRLQAVETVFAMTVHKSQGSEFAHAALVLPDRPSPVLTRELIYTGITRARHWFTLATFDAGHDVLDDAVRRKVRRAVSGWSSHLESTRRLWTMVPT